MPTDPSLTTEEYKSTCFELSALIKGADYDGVVIGVTSMFHSLGVVIILKC